MSAISEFPGIPAAGLKFLRDLKKHNDREWFTPRKHLYEEHVRDPMLALIGAVHRRMLKFAPAYVDEPKKCLYRIYRDTRFAKDKTPYKTHAAALFWHRGLGKEAGAGFYFAFSGEEVAIGAGLYSPSPESLLAVRRRIAAEPEEFVATYGGRRTEKLLGKLAGAETIRMPKGFDTTHPAADILRRKQLMFYITLDPQLAQKPEFIEEVTVRFKAATPFVDYLNRPILALSKAAKKDLLW